MEPLTMFVGGLAAFLGSIGVAHAYDRTVGGFQWCRNDRSRSEG